MKSCAVAIVGHVDHGKTALVRALTGQETDRLDEEKARGLSITLGFAHRTYESGIVDFIDSPGHEDFIRAMVCGATGAQAALIIISSVEGVQRQTREHVEILQHLNVRCGIVVLTKADLVAADDRRAVQADIKKALGESPFANEPFVFCSAHTGEGLDELNAAIEALNQRAPDATALPGSFLPIDRAFTLKGVGTVATGTLLGAPLKLDDPVVLQPQVASASVRRLQARGSNVAQALPGARTAVNLRGVAIEDLHRGDVICTPNMIQPSSEIDVRVDIAPDRRGLKNGDQVRFLAGTASHVATAFIWGGDKQIEAGAAYVRLRFTEPVAVHAKQYGVLRRLSPAETLGGIKVIDPAPDRARRRDPARLAVLEASDRGDPIETAMALSEAGKGAIELADLRRLLVLGTIGSATPDLEGFDTIGADHIAHQDSIASTKSAILDAVAEILKHNQAQASVPIIEIQRALAKKFAAPLMEFAAASLLKAGKLIGRLTALSLPDRDPLSDLSTNRRQKLAGIERALRDGGLMPPELSELQGEAGRDADLIKLLVAAGRAKFLSSTSQKHTPLLHMDAINTAYEQLSDVFPPPQEFTTSEAREVLNTTRKFAIPVLEYFDKQGLTHRNGNVRRLVPPKV